MTPAQMSALHGAAFDASRGWSAAEFASLLSHTHTTALTRPHGFALIRTLAGETELLTLAVDPNHQRQGIAKALIADWFATARAYADTAFLDVAADNTAARALYETCGFEISSRRSGYYARPNGHSVDALLLKRDLTFGQTPDSGMCRPESG